MKKKNPDCLYYKNTNRKAKIIKCTGCEETKIVVLSAKHSTFTCDKCKTTYVEIECSHCGKIVVKRKSSIKSKYVFCDRECKEKEQVLGGLLELENYKTNNNYRKLAFEKYGHKCNLCDITEDYLLVVHHIDSNRNNNNIENLEVLCHNHHAFRHRQWDGEKWILRLT